MKTRLREANRCAGTWGSPDPPSWFTKAPPGEGVRMCEEEPAARLLWACRRPSSAWSRMSAGHSLRGWKEEWKLSFLQVKLSTRLRSGRTTGRRAHGLPAAGNGSWGRAPHFLWELMSPGKESQELPWQPDPISSPFEEWLLNTLAVTFQPQPGPRVSPLYFIHAF